MPDLPEEEYDALDDLWTNNPPRVSGDGKSGFFMQHRNEIVILDDLSSAWLRTKAETERTTTTEILSELVRKEMFARVASA